MAGAEPPVTSELKELLHQFVLAVIKNKIENAGLVDYGVKYFTELKKLKKKGVRHSWWATGVLSDHGVNHPHNEIDHETVVELPKASPEVLARRRHSVSAEVFDPNAQHTVKVVPKSKKELELLSKVTNDVLILRSLDTDSLKKVIDSLYKVKVTAGEDVIVQGAEEANEFYIIESGMFDILVKDPSGDKQKVGEYKDEGSFGELALMYNQPRAATVTAKTAGQLWALDRKTFQHLVLGAAYKKRENYLKVLVKVDFFAELKDYERSSLCDALKPKQFKAREKIVAEGDEADGMYIVESGEVTVVKFILGKEKELGKLGPGGYFGELALTTKKPRAATVMASTDVPLAFLDVQAFERLLGPCREILNRNATKYEKQLAEVSRTEEAPKP